MHQTVQTRGLDLPDDAGIEQLFQTAMRRGPDRVALSYRDTSGRRGTSGWQDVTYKQFHRDVEGAALQLLREGVGRGERVGVLGRNCYAWTVADFATLIIGAVTVPIYPTASAEQIRHILDDSGMAFCFCEDGVQRGVLDNLGQCRLRVPVWPLEAVGAAQDRVEDCADLEASDELAWRRATLRADDLATIVYTSGTTGTPKGCMLTHRNIFFSSVNTVVRARSLFARTGGQPSRTLLVLPLSHIFGRTMLLSCLWGGTHTALVSGVPEMMAELGTWRPTFLAVVPYVLEKIRKVTAGVPVEAVAQRLGGALSHVICGGASLDPSTVEFYRAAGTTVLECYGLTEAATAVTVSAPETNRVGTVGRPIPGVEVRIAQDGEVLVRGRNVSPGYWPHVEAGPRWLPTGDLGRLDGGYLHITGRRKEILVTSSGKNVAPALLEDRVRLHPLVSNCMVVGEGRSFVAALVTLDEAALRDWAARRGADPDDPGLRSDLSLLAEVGAGVEEANSLVSRAESIRKFRVLSGDFTVAGGQLTPSLKLRRKQIESEYETEITALYGAR